MTVVVTCAADPTCTRPVKSREMCAVHYARWYAHGGKSEVKKYGPRDETLEQKLDRKTKVDPETGCWEKDGWVTDYGYGRIWWQGRYQYMHVLRYELHVGPIPTGKELDHLCRNATCSNPDHLEPVTHKENFNRGRRWNKDVPPHKGGSGRRPKGQRGPG